VPEQSLNSSLWRGTSYAEENDGWLVRGNASKLHMHNNRVLSGWVGRDLKWSTDEPHSLEDYCDNNVALWPYIRDVDAYRCSGGMPGNLVTYAPVIIANGKKVEGVYLPDAKEGHRVTVPGKRVGKTVLRLRKLSDIISPGASQRAILVDQRHKPTSNDFYVHYSLSPVEIV